MLKSTFTGVLAAVCLFGFACSSPQKTSKVPDRREFPVSEKIEPCENFFEYACGPAIEKFELRPDRSRHIFSFNDSADRILEAKKSYLKRLGSQKVQLNEKSQQLNDYFASCMNTEARATEEKAKLQKLVAKMNSLNSKKAFAAWLTQQALEGQPSHLSFSEISNLDDSTRHDLIVLPTLMTTMPDRSYYKNQELLADYKVIVTAFFSLAGLEDAESKASSVIELETHFINHYPTPAERRPLWSKRAYNKASHFNRFKNLELSAFFRQIPAAVKIRNPMQEPLQQLDQAFAKFSLDQLKAAYLFWSTSGMIDESHPEFFKQYFAFRFKHLGGAPERAVLEERCTEDVMARFLKELDHEIYPEIFADFSEEKFVSLLEKVRASIVDGLEKNKWLSAQSKRGALEKIKKARFQVVKPTTDEDWDFNPVNKYDPKGFLANQALLDKSLTKKSLEELTKKVNPNKWWMGPLTVNAYYSPSENKFVMPAGILQYPFYDPNLPDWVNLGAVGMVVGHELGHGVDDQGAKYDAKGSVKQWMTQKDIETFQQRGARLVAQFDAAGHDGRLTLGENIGDLVGLTFALGAAQKTMPEESQARDQATRDFFVQYARGWCGVMRPKEIEKRLKTDPHALVWARVNEQVKHQGEFSRVYTCKPGQALYLNENDRIAIW